MSLFNFFTGGDKRAAQPTQKEFYTVTGQASFRVDVEVSGNPPYSNCSVSVNAVQNHANRLVIGSMCEWFRCFYAQDTPMRGNGNTYRLSALDIGATIKVKVTSTEPDEAGEAIVTFGPILLEPGQKNTLKNIIRSGGAKFEVESLSPFSTDEGLHAGAIVLFQNHLKVNMHHTKQDLRIYFGESFELQQGTDDKTLVFKFFDAIKGKELSQFFQLAANAQPVDKLCIKLVSQLSRDNLGIAIRCFESMIDLKDKILVEKTLENLPFEYETPQKRITITNEDISTNLDEGSMKQQLVLLAQSNKQVKFEKERLDIHAQSLDGEISRTQYCRIDLT
jgi:hypothetical protein